MSTRPNWITTAGSLGVIPEGEFFRIPVVAESDATVKYRVIAGNLPIGMQVTTDGFVEGIPRNAVLVRGEPQDVGTDITSSFAVRAYTERAVNGLTVIDRLADRTFEITVVSQSVPEFVTPAGLIGTYYDGNEVDLQLEFTDGNLDDEVRVALVSGELPPGISISRTGAITGVIQPYSRLVTGLTLPPDTIPGYDNTPKDEYPSDFSVRSSSRNYQFALEITDGKDSNVRTFEIYVYAKDSMTADTIDFTADNTFITADVVSTRTPVITTPEGSIGRVRSDNYFAFKFDAVDFDGDDLEFDATTGAGLGFDETLFDETGVGFDRAALSLPPGLTFDVDTGWLSGYIPDLGATELDYRFALLVRKKQPAATEWDRLTAYTRGAVVRFSTVNFYALQDVPYELFNQQRFEASGSQDTFVLSTTQSTETVSVYIRSTQRFFSDGSSTDFVFGTEFVGFDIAVQVDGVSISDDEFTVDATTGTLQLDSVAPVGAIITVVLGQNMRAYSDFIVNGNQLIMCDRTTRVIDSPTIPPSRRLQVSNSTGFTVSDSILVNFESRTVTNVISGFIDIDAAPDDVVDIGSYVIKPLVYPVGTEVFVNYYQGISPAFTDYWDRVPNISSELYYFVLTIAGDTDTDIIWQTEPDLGFITNGAISTYSIEAFNVGGRSLLFRLVSGSRSRLPQGLTLLPSGNIVGRASFNTFAVDQGTTTFDRGTRKVYEFGETTFDSQFNFTVNAYCPQTEQLGYQVERIDIVNGGIGYTEQPTIIIAPPPLSENSIRATAGVVTTDSNGRITGIAVGNPGRGYLTPPTITISGGGGGSGAEAVAVIAIVDLVNAVSVQRTFTIRVQRVYNEPYESLYIKAMPSRDNRQLLNSLLYNQNLLPVDSIYRYDDPNFGVSRAIKYVHAYGLTASTIDQYVQSMELNHYWKNLVIGPVRTAQALDTTGQQVYEVIYCDIIDDLINNAGISVDASVDLPYPVDTEDSTGVDVVYPNSLVNMRDRVISAIGQEETILPLWMTSRQANGEVLGFRPVWVIAYVKPGEAERLAYRIRTEFGDLFNRIDYRADRYELDRSQTWLWNSELKQWGDGPPQATTFDSFTQYLYFATILDTNGTIESTELFQGDGHQTAFGFVPLLDAGQLIVTIDGVTQPYLEPETEDIDTAYRIFYQFTLPFYNIQQWDIDRFWPAESVVVNGERYYRARFEVPPGNAITNEFYWRQIPAPNQIEFQNPPANDSVIGVYQLKNKWVLNPNSLSRRSTTFDGGSTTFVNLSDQFTGGDERDKYLVFPRVNILG